MIKDLLVGKTSVEIANIKGQEIAKIDSVARTNVKFSGADYDIEIVDTKAIEGGVEVLARAWDAKGRVGFGDGTVDIERFSIFNPPINPPDGTKTKFISEVDAVEREADNFEENPQKALLFGLAHIIKVKKEKHGPERVIPNKIGNTTSTFYPAAGANTPVDGNAAYDSSSVSFATIRAAAGTGGNNGSDVGGGDFVDMIRIQSAGTSDNYDSMYVGIFLFDTSSIPDTDTISSATASWYGFAKFDNFSQSFVLTNSDPDATNNITSADYTDHVTDMATELGTSRITITDLSTTAYNDFGVTSPDSNVSKTSLTKLGLRVSADFDNSAPTWSASVSGGAQVFDADTTGTTKDPKLVVEHAAGGGGANHNNLLLLGIG